MKKVTLPNCSFCNSEVIDATFAESDNFRAIYNIAPILPGHSLVIPKWHIQSLIDLSDEELYEMITFGRNVVKKLLIAFHAQAFNWTIQEGEEAGQTVLHLHLHLIPRKPKDLLQPGDWYPLIRESLNNYADVIDSESRPRLTSEEMKKIVYHLQKEIGEIEGKVVEVVRSHLEL